MVILLYHSIARPSPLSRIHGLYTTPKQFDWQIRWFLRQGFRFTTFERTGPDQLFQQPENTAILTFDDGSTSIYNNGFQILQRYNIPAVLFPIASLIARQDVHIVTNTDPAPQSFVTPDQIRELGDAGWEIGSHLLSHRPVTKLTDEELKEELQESKSILEAIAGKPVITVAYPYGQYDVRTLQFATRAGYLFGLTTDQQPLGTHPLLELPRTAMKGSRWHHQYTFLRIFSKYGA
ncbi:MAG: polysaccharide deacetylase family protein [Bacteroidetes bacterium]|nr:MAG: polysaccharide deacetylase family protein [Bacteroidota bacterium]